MSQCDNSLGQTVLGWWSSRVFDPSLCDQPFKCNYGQICSGRIHLAVKKSRSFEKKIFMQYQVLVHSSQKCLNQRCDLAVTVSHRFGFGLMDCEAMVNLAENWQTAPPQLKYHTHTQRPEA